MKSLAKGLGVFLIIAVTIVLNRDLIEIRILELDRLLDDAARIQGVSNTTGMAGKIELIRRRLEDGESRVSHYVLEARLQAVTLDGSPPEKSSSSSIRRVILPVRPVLSLLRMAMGKRPGRPDRESRAFGLLESGYLFERTRHYAEAIAVYDRVLAFEDYNPAIYPSVLLHKAFCFLMINNYSNARDLLHSLLASHTGTEEAVLAWELLDFMENMEDRRMDALRKRLQPEDLGKQYYFLIAYASAVEQFDSYLRQSKGDSRESEALYFRGRSFEELGQVGQAVSDYDRVIRYDGSMVWAREAYRRKLMIGDFYEKQTDQSQEAREVLVALGDSALLADIESLRQIVRQPAASAASATPIVSAETMAVTEVDPPAASAEPDSTPVSPTSATSGESGEIVASAESRSTVAQGIASAMLHSQPSTSGERRNTAVTKNAGAVVSTHREATVDAMRLPQSGILQIETKMPNMAVYIDGEYQGMGKSGVFGPLPPGRCELFLLNSDESFVWSGQVEIAPDEITHVFIEPYPFGAVTYELPVGVKASLEEDSKLLSFVDSGRLDFVPAGRYELSMVEGESQIGVSVLNVIRGREIQFRPLIEKAQGSAVPDGTSWPTLKAATISEDLFAGRLEILEGHLSANRPIGITSVSAADLLLDELERSPRRYPDLVSRAQTVSVQMKQRIASRERNEEVVLLQQQRQLIQDGFDKDLARRRTFRTGSWVSLGLGIGSLAATGYSVYKGNESYDQYTKATSEKKAVALRNETTLYQTAFIITGIIAGLGISAFTILQLLQPDVDSIDDRLQDIDDRIRTIEQK